MFPKLMVVVATSLLLSAMILLGDNLFHGALREVLQVAASLPSSALQPVPAPSNNHSPAVSEDGLTPPPSSSSSSLLPTTTEGHRLYQQVNQLRDMHAKSVAMLLCTAVTFLTATLFSLSPTVSLPHCPPLHTTLFSRYLRGDYASSGTFSNFLGVLKHLVAFSVATIIFLQLWSISVSQASNPVHSSSNIGSTKADAPPPRWSVPHSPTTTTTTLASPHQWSVFVMMLVAALNYMQLSIQQHQGTSSEGFSSEGTSSEGTSSEGTSSEGTSSELEDGAGGEGCAHTGSENSQLSEYKKGGEATPDIRSRSEILMENVMNLSIYVFLITAMGWWLCQLVAPFSFLILRVSAPATSDNSSSQAVTALGGFNMFFIACTGLPLVMLLLISNLPLLLRLGTTTARERLPRLAKLLPLLLTSPSFFAVSQVLLLSDPNVVVSLPTQEPPVLPLSLATTTNAAAAAATVTEVSIGVASTPVNRHLLLWIPLFQGVYFMAIALSLGRPSIQTRVGVSPKMGEEGEEG